MGVRSRGTLFEPGKYLGLVGGISAGDGDRRPGHGDHGGYNSDAIKTEYETNHSGASYPMSLHAGPLPGTVQNN